LSGFYIILSFDSIFRPLFGQKSFSRCHVKRTCSSYQSVKSSYSITSDSVVLTTQSFIELSFTCKVIEIVIY